MANIALYPGGYKPPHIGHYEAAKEALKEADKVIVFVGPKERDSITQNMSIALWKLYTQNDPIEIRPAGVSPVKDVYDFVELEAEDGDTLYFIKGKKDSEDSRFNKIPTYAEKFGKKIPKPKFIDIEDKFSRSGNPVSGTSMRSYIKNNDKESFIDGLPLGVDEEAAWSIVTTKPEIEENYYSPDEHYRDFAKSSEYKAGLPDGHKEDIPSNKYLRIQRQSKPLTYETRGGESEMHIYDFDETIARAETPIPYEVKSPSGEVIESGETTSVEFENKREELENEYDEGVTVDYNFDAFKKLIGDATLNNEVFQKLLESIKNPNAKVTILTARSVGYPVTQFLKEQGIWAYVVPLGLKVDGAVTGQDKANWIDERIKDTTKKVIFIDDSDDNKEAVSMLSQKYPNIEFDIQDPPPMDEMMMGTMNNQEKAKHAKNLKRLNKDLKKQGNQYMKVPNYLKGTLKRKLYKEQFKPKTHDNDPYHHDNKKGHYTTSVATINNKNIPLEVMRTPDDQITGMMGRDEMKAGMIFPYDKVSKKDFHMEGCLIPLDIVFINKGTIDTIHDNCPPCKEMPCPKYSGMADNVLELPGGYCKKHNIKVGDNVNFNLTERKLTKKELKNRERIAKDLPDSEFKKRYGKDWKSVKLATATKRAKKMKEYQAGTGEIYVYDENYPMYKANQVQQTRYKASDVFTRDIKKAKKMGYLEGDTYEKMAAKGKKKGNLKQGTVRKRLKIKAGDKIPLSKINKAISRIKKMKNPSEKNKKYLKALNLAKTLKTTTHKENINERDPKKGTGKKPKGSGRRLYTDENPKDTVKVKFSTRQDIVDTLTKKSFKSKPHKRQSQIINLIHQRVRAALSRTKDPQKKKRLRSAFEYIKKRKEASKRKTQRLKKESINLNEQIYIPEDAGCMQFCDPVDFEDSNNLLGEEQLLIVPICLPGYKPEDSEFIESYQFMFGYNNDILQWNQQYSQIVSQMPQLFGLPNALAGGMGIQNENQPGVVSYAFATAEPFDWSETDVLTYLVFVVTGNGISNFTWNQNAGGTDVNPNMTSYYVYGVTDCFEDSSISVGVEEEDVCGDFENSIPVNISDFCTKCETNSWVNSGYEQYCECCPEGLPEPEGLPLKDKLPLKNKPKKEPIKKEPPALTKEWWKHQIKKTLTEGGAAGHMAHPFNLPDVNSGKDLKDIFNKSAESLQNDPGSVKIDGVNSSIRLVDIEGEKQFVMDRGSKKELDVKGITKDDLLDRFGDGHGMVKIGGEVLDMFNKALPSIKGDLEKLGAYDDPNILFNMEYVSGKTNVQDYGSNFIAIHGLNKIETKEVQGKRKMLTKRTSSEISYDKSDLQSLLDNLAPVAKEQGFEVYGSVPTEMTKKPNFSSALSQNYTIISNEGEKTQTLDTWLNELNNIPEEDFIFMNVDNSRKKVGAVSKQVYTTLLKGGNIDELFEDENDKQKAIEGFTTYLATEKLGDEVLKVLDSPMGSVENHEGVVIRDEKIANIPFKITGKFILGGMASDF